MVGVNAYTLFRVKQGLNTSGGKEYPGRGGSLAEGSGLSGYISVENSGVRLHDSAPGVLSGVSGTCVPEQEHRQIRV